MQYAALPIPQRAAAPRRAAAQPLERVSRLYAARNWVARSRSAVSLAFLQKNVWGIYRDTTAEPPERDPELAERNSASVELTVGATPPVLVPDSFPHVQLQERVRRHRCADRGGRFRLVQQSQQPV
jgi:hypothetical protein